VTSVAQLFDHLLLRFRASGGVINLQKPTPAETKLLNALRAANVPFEFLGETGGRDPQLLITVPAPH
jgi:hypothetical protein